MIFDIFLGVAQSDVFRFSYFFNTYIRFRRFSLVFFFFLYVHVILVCWSQVLPCACVCLIAFFINRRNPVEITMWYKFGMCISGLKIFVFCGNFLAVSAIDSNLTRSPTLQRRFLHFVVFFWCFFYILPFVAGLWVDFDNRSVWVALSYAF